MGLREEIKPFMDKYGLVHHDTTRSSGNVLRYTSEYYICLKIRGELTPQDVIDFHNAVILCQRLDKTGKRIPGLYNRNPGRNDYQNAHDDYSSLMRAFYEFELWSLAREVLDHGRKNFWTFNNVNPGEFNFSAFIGRMPQLVAHFHYCNKIQPSFFTGVWHAGNIMLSERSTTKHNQDGWMLTSHYVAASKDQNSMCRRAGAEWTKKATEVWPEGPGAVLIDYFTHPHPTAKYWPKHW